jgi:hypothetical protein
MTGMDLIALAPWAPWVLFGAALAVIILRLRRPRRSGARRDRRAETDRGEQASAPPCEPSDHPRSR